MAGPALCRQDGLAQGAIAQRLGRHKSWVCRRLLLVEALDPAVQADVRLGLLAARAAVALAQVPRGNQLAAAEVVVRRGLTVRQTEQLVVEVIGCESAAQRERVLESWRDGSRIPTDRTASRRRLRSEAGGCWPTSLPCAGSGRGCKLACSGHHCPLSARVPGRWFGARSSASKPVLDALASTVVNATATPNPAPRGEPRLQPGEAVTSFVHQVVALARQKVSFHAIAKTLSISRNTVKKRSCASTRPSARMCTPR
ncbi:MAG: hypothetical protein IPM35_31640 [Myxococcales bacterium]|nr:hypothetical protein [Myxococcales bacterium]